MRGFSRACCGLLHDFNNDRRGSIALTFAIMSIMMLGLVGTSVDFGRWLSARTETLNAMDAAVLAGGRILQLPGKTSADAIAAADKYYARNRSSSLDVDNTVFKVNNNEIIGTSSSTVKTPFLKFVGQGSLPVNLTAKAILAAGGGGGSNNTGTHVEVAMMLDTTGSMGGNKMVDLKVAAKDLIDIVVWTDQSNYTSRVALAPFSEFVNVSASHFHKIAGPDAGKYVVATTEEVTVEVPVEREVCEEKTKIVSVQKWSSKKNRWVTKERKKKVTECSTVTETETQTQTQTTTETINLVDKGDKYTCIKERSTSDRYTDQAPSANNYFDYFGQPIEINADDVWEDDEIADNPEIDKVINNGSSCRPGAIITPLTSDKALLKSRIDAFPTTGMTAGHLGTQWAWYLISPKWSSIWPMASEPKAYSMVNETNSDGRPKLFKIAILMTDGSYNKQYSGHSSTTQAREICTKMKAAGVTVYTVGFAISVGSSPDLTTQQCATSPSH